MMSEKRFTFYYERGNEVVIEDNGKILSNKKIVDLLNEQQATINNQEQKIKILQQEISDTQAILEMLTDKLKGWNNE